MDLATALLIEALQGSYSEKERKETFKEYALARFEGNTYLKRKVKQYFEVEEAKPKEVI